MTKTQKRELARSVRSHLMRYQHLQEPDLQEYMRDKGRDPAQVALDHLRRAKDELELLYQTELAAFQEAEQGKKEK